MAQLKTAPFVKGLRGRTGNLVFRQTRYGTQLLDREAGRDPKSPAQIAARERMARVGEAWRSLSFEESSAWNAYAEASDKPTTGQLLFSKLSMRILHINPSADLPKLPPSEAFGGDSIEVSASISGSKIVFSANRAHRGGVVSEILIQPLASRHRAAYAEKYRTQAFVSFENRRFELDVRPGCYALAVRTLDSRTGQATSLQELGRVEVIAQAA